MDTTPVRPHAGSGSGAETARASLTAPLAVLWAVLLAYVAIFVVLVSSFRQNTLFVYSVALTDGTWLLAALATLALNRRVARGAWPLALLLAALAWLGDRVFDSSLFYVGLDTPVLTFLAVLACSSAFERHPDAMAPFLRDHTSGGVARSLGLALAVGTVLGVINAVLIAVGYGEPIRPGLALDRVQAILSPAIYEELAMRAGLLALAVTLLRGRPRRRSAWVVTFLLMTIPHLLPHLTFQVALQPLLDNLVIGAVLFVLFAAPFAILQLRRDLTTAMVAHGWVDLIRFLAFGV